MSKRGCVNNPNVFCYICGSYIISMQRQNITTFVEKAYYAYFGVKLGDQDRSWAPHTVCRTCVDSLRNGSKGRKKAMPFGVHMVWREPQNHGNDCYFCTCVVKGHNQKSKHEIVYPDLQSARRPLPHAPDIPVPPAEFESSLASSSTNEDDLNDSEYHWPSPEQQRFVQNELNDLVRDLGLTKEAAEVLGSRLSTKNLLAPNTTFSWYRHREKEYLPYLQKKANWYTVVIFQE